MHAFVYTLTYAVVSALLHAWVDSFHDSCVLQGSGAYRPE